MWWQRFEIPRPRATQCVLSSCKNRLFLSRYITGNALGRINFVCTHVPSHQAPGQSTKEEILAISLCRPNTVRQKKASALLTHSVRNKLHLCIGCKFGASSLVEIEWQLSVGCYLLVKQSCEQCRYCYKPFANFPL